MPRIAVVYLARLAEGFETVEAFAKSYRDHPAGQPHDLIIVCKGFSKAGEMAAIGAIFNGIEHRLLSVDDDIGFDLHAYMIAARQFKHEYFCFLNTYTQIRSEDWLRKLFANLCRPGVGIVGATGSYESLYNSYKVINRVSWSVASQGAFRRAVVRRIAWSKRLVNLAPRWALAAPRAFYRHMRRAVGDVLARRAAVAERFDGVWNSAVSFDGVFSHIRDFPHFPNPHIRTNVFMLRREDFLTIYLDDQNSDKFECNFFESGHNGLSLTTLRKGARLVVVGADGRGYDLEEWPNCRGFRSGDQSNLLASDNHTRAFDTMSPDEKTAHATMTWGGYLHGSPPDATLRGVTFSNERRLSEIARTPNRKHERDRLFSIVIPTHNRLSLVLDAIKTVTHQNYHNWEIVVFDNASTESVGDAVRAMRDPRIRRERSDTFLGVTDSWNRATDLARGDYVTLIGDDDGLAPGFFERLNQLADRFDDPDVVFSSLYQFMYPGVSPRRRLGYLGYLKTASFFEERDYPFLIDKRTAQRAVDGSLRMRRSFLFNMPAFTVRRQMLTALRRDGKVFHSPLPDCYFANLVLDRANKLVGEPRPLAFESVSRDSLGPTFLGDQAEDDFEALGQDASKDELWPSVSRHILPGPAYNSRYILAMAHVAREIGNPARQADFSRYRKMQILHLLRSQGSCWRWRSTSAGRALWDSLLRREKIWAVGVNSLYKRATAIWPALEWRVEKMVNQHAFQPAQIVLNSGDFVSGFEVFQALAQGGVIRRDQSASAA